MAARKLKEPAEPSKLEIEFGRYWLMMGLKGEHMQPREQFYFDMARRWRFDFAWPAWRVAVELHGGEHSGGRHTTGVGLIADCEKMRAAQIRGWIVLPMTGTELRSGPVQRIAEVCQAIRIGMGRMGVSQ